MKRFNWTLAGVIAWVTVFWWLLLTKQWLWAVSLYIGTLIVLITIVSLQPPKIRRFSKEESDKIKNWLEEIDGKADQS